MWKNHVLIILFLLVLICQTNAFGSEGVQAHQRQQMAKNPVSFDKFVAYDVLSMLQHAEEKEEEATGSHPQQPQVLMIAISKTVKNESLLENKDEEDLFVEEEAGKEDDVDDMEYLAFVRTNVIDQDFQAEEEEQEPHAKVYVKHNRKNDNDSGSAFNHVLYERRRSLENELKEFEISFMTCMGSTALLTVMLLFARSRQRRRADNERRMLTPDSIADLEIIDSYRYESNYASM